MEIQPCIKCGRGLKAPLGITQTGDRAIAVYITAVSVGMRPRIRSKLRRSVLCTKCAVSICYAPAPEGSFNVTIWECLQELDRQSAQVIEAAREQNISPRAPLRLMPGSQDPTLTGPSLRSVLSR